ncbi:MAG: methionine adenosyltransferase [Nitrospiraceae bacterium]|nr:methionine adenosyltransferase [Nitrospiraceae bacterium]
MEIESLGGRPVSEEAVECVERKGLGHPDTMTDLLCEAVSVSLAKEYKRLSGAVLHYNADKGFLAAGRARRAFQGGRIARPMRFFMGDRATFRAGGVKIPVAEIAVGAARKWLKENLRFVEPERHMVFHPELAPGSAQLARIYAEGARRPLGANDTSAAVGYWPLSPTEQAVLGIEGFLNSKAFKRRYPETGEDVKVMAVREKRALTVTIAMPLIDRFLRHEAEYFVRKEMILGEIDAFLRREYGGAGWFDDFLVHLNSLDVRGSGMAGIYLSVLGTSAEDADSGQAGRGNRANGLISFSRPQTIEAAAGKNPMSHTGKIYGVLSHLLAKKVFEAAGDALEAYVLLVSRIGMEINRPAAVSVKLRLPEGADIRDFSDRIEAAVEEELSEKNILSFVRRLAAGRLTVC